MAHDDTPGEESDPDAAARSDEAPAESVDALVLRSTPLSTREAGMLREVSFDLFYAQYEWAWTQIRRQIWDDAKARELTQDVFVSLHLYLRDHGFSGPPRALLRTFIAGTVQNFRRVEGRDPISIGLPSSSSESPRTPNVERLMDARTVAQEILAELTDEQREVVMLVLVAEVPYEEARRTLGISIGTLRSRLMTAKARLLELLLERFPPSRGNR